MRVDGRESNVLWNIEVILDYLMYLEGFVLIVLGNIKVICFVSVEIKVLLFMWGEGCGWIFVEYLMLLWVINIWNICEFLKGKVIGRIMEI